MNNVIKNISFLILVLATLHTNNIFAKSDSLDFKYLLEEEKLASDVYSVLGEKWNLKIFSNIHSSEMHHREMVNRILISENISYELFQEIGKFKNAEIQELYNSLIKKGLKTVKDALEVGLAIEEKDIADLELIIKQTKNQTHLDTLSALLTASYRHKAAFIRNLEKY